MVYPAAVLGPGDPKASGQYIQNLMHRRMPGTVFNNTVLTWVHVRDVAEAIARALEKEGNLGAKYLIGKERMSFRELNALISDIASVSLPWIALPDSMVMMTAALLTWLAKLTKKHLCWGCPSIRSGQ